MIGGGRLKKSSATKTTFHRPKVTKELEDMEPLFLLVVSTVPCPPAGGRWNVVTPRYFETPSEVLIKKTTPNQLFPKYFLQIYLLQNILSIFGVGYFNKSIGCTFINYSG